MNKPAYILSARAENDLRSITLYTTQNHGRKQTIKHRNQLEVCSENLAQVTHGQRMIADTKPAIRYLRCQHHYIFGYLKDNQLIIIAILHERMDLINRVKNRL